MTPQIALDLSHDGISMLSRAPDGRWWREGMVRLDDPDIGTSLSKLRETAVERAGSDFASILILPDDQLLFTSLERDDRDPSVTIRSGLKGRTPYEVEELLFDHEVRGDRLRVAVAARETLAEAEAFAEKFSFRPVALVGNPGDVPYDGIPFFGRTEKARLYMDGTRLELALQRGFEIDKDGPPPEEAPTFSHSGPDQIFTTARFPDAADPEGGLARLAPRLHAAPVEPEIEAETPKDAVAAPERPASPRRKVRAEKATRRPGPDGPEMALPGLARQQAQQAGRRGNIGLYLTLSLLTVLMGVALWTVFSAPGGKVDDPVAVTTPDVQPETTASAIDQARRQTPAPVPDAIDPATLLPEAGSQRSLATADLQVPEPITAPDSAPLVIAPASEAPVAPVTEIQTLAALPAQTESLRLVAINPVRMGQDAISLPRAVPPRDGFAPQTLPPQPGETFDLDAETGLVAASPEGTPAPGGYVVVSGRPDIMPRRRPAPSDAQRAALSAETQAEQAILRRIRPIRRPDDLPLAEPTTPEAETEGETILVAGGDPARPRPAPRPGTDGSSAADEIADAAIQAAQQAAAASLARRDEDLAAIAAGEGEAATQEPGSALALAQSSRPRTRPDAAIRAAAAARQAQQQQVAAAATAGTSTQSSGNAPRIRSAGGSVARAATDENILRLNQMNLIGVYGRPQDRRALVRLKNGRYVKVEVGDRLDRGRVTAIGDGELRYQRGGRNIVLRMPPV